MTTLNIRIDEQLKKDAQMVLKKRGLDVSTAVRMYLADLVEEKRREWQKEFFQTSKGKALLARWEKDAEEALKTGKSYKTAEEMHADILK